MSCQIWNFLGKIFHSFIISTSSLAKNPPTANKYHVISQQSCQYLLFASQYHVANLCELMFDFLLYRQNSNLPSCLKRWTTENFEGECIFLFHQRASKALTSGEKVQSFPNHNKQHQI